MNRRTTAHLHAAGRLKPMKERHQEGDAMAIWFVSNEAWGGGIEVRREGQLDPEMMTAKGRFLIRAVERNEEIAHTLRNQVGTHFVEAFPWVDMKKVEEKSQGWKMPKASIFVEELGPLPRTKEEVEALSPD